MLTTVEALRERGADDASARRCSAWWRAPGEARDRRGMHTPPYPLHISAMAPEAATALADRPRDPRAPLPGVNGEAAATGAFAAAWSARTGATARVFRRMRLHRLDTLVAPDPPPPGSAVVAGPQHRDLLVAWYEAFGAEIEEPPRDHGPTVEDRLSYAGFALWVVGGEAVSLAGTTRAVAGAARVAPVYTPPEHRGRGYAAGVTAAVTRAALRPGSRRCCSTPTSRTRRATGCTRGSATGRVEDSVSFAVRRLSVRPPPALGVELRLLALAERVALAALGVEERLHALPGARILRLLGREAQLGKELAQRSVAPAHGSANVRPREAAAQATRPGAKRSPCSSTRARTASASNTSRSGSPAARALADLVPRERRRDGRPLPRAQRVHVDRRLVLVVLAPVDEHLAAAQRLASGATRRASGSSRSSSSATAFAKPFVTVVGRRGVQRDVDLQALRARRLGEALQPEAAEHALEQQARRGSTRRSSRARRGRGRTRASSGGSMSSARDERRVQLEVGEVGEPDERRAVVADDELDRLRARRHARGRAPSRAGATARSSRRSTARRRRWGSA